MVALLLAASYFYVRSLNRGTAGVDAAAAELQARRIGYVKLMTQGKELLASGDFEDAALFFKTAEELAIDPAGARRLREEAEQRAEEQGAHLDELDAQQALQSGNYADVVATARRMMDTRAGREKAAGVLADVQEELAKARTARSRQPRDAPPPQSQIADTAAAAPAPPAPAPTATVNFGVLRIELHSDAPEGVFVASVDDDQVAHEKFQFYERAGWFRKRAKPGSLHVERTLWPGDHTVRVVLQRGDEKGQTSTIKVPIEAGAMRTLIVRLPRTGVSTHQLL